MNEVVGLEGEGTREDEDWEREWRLNERVGFDGSVGRVRRGDVGG